MPCKSSTNPVMGPMPTTEVSSILPPVTFFTPPAIKKMFGFPSYPYTRSEPLRSLNKAALSLDVSFLDMPNALLQVRPRFGHNLALETIHLHKTNDDPA
uniref:Uncharacterized protein n=1 Tax=Romanomermis culicivorax TaxID=13658 RepID=A0A915JIY6_ROMCU